MPHPLSTRGNLGFGEKWKPRPVGPDGRPVPAWQWRLECYLGFQSAGAGNVHITVGPAERVAGVRVDAITVPSGEE